jgi:hypothetical protein
MADIAISYDHRDKHTADELGGRLMADGYSVWWSKHIKPGMAYQTEISNQIKNSRILIPVWTSRSVQSEWVNSETMLAHEMEIPIIPVLSGAVSRTEILPPFNIIHRISIEEYSEITIAIRDILKPPNDKAKGHPLCQYQRVLDRLGVLRWAQFEAKCQQGSASGVLAGMLESLRERRSAKGNRFAFAAFSDPSGQFEAVLFPDVLAASRVALDSGKPLLLRMEAERDGETLKLRAQSVVSLERAAAGVTKGIRIIVDKPEAFMRVRDVLSANGRGEVRFAVRVGPSQREMEVRLPGRFDISPDRTAALHGVPGVLEVQEL